MSRLGLGVGGHGGHGAFQGTGASVTSVDSDSQIANARGGNDA